MASLEERKTLASSLFDEGRCEEAERLLLELADEGSTHALLFLGYMSEAGTVRPKDLKVARYYFEQAALAGDPEGYVRLGSLLIDEGQSEPAQRAFDSAERLLHAGPDKGSIHSWVTLGLLHENGTNRPKDVEVAKGYYAQAVEFCDPEACMRLGRLYFDEGAWVQARKVFETGADTGHIGNMYWLGATLLKDQTGSGSNDQAIAWLNRAATAGHITAQRDLIHIRAARSGSWLEKAMVAPKIVALAARAIRLILRNRHSDKLW